MRKFLLSLIILIILGGVVFYFGWIQFRIPEGHYAVVFTKTHGYEGTALEAGTFAWRWQALLPTNLTLHTYSAEPFSATLSSEGSLPSASLYAQELEDEPSFDYSLRVRISYRFEPERLPELLQDEVVEPEEIIGWYETQERAMQQQLLSIVSENLSTLAEAEGVASLSAELSETIRSDLEEMYPFLTVTSVVPREVRLPDLQLYRAARDLYYARIEARREAVATVGVDAASQEVRQESRIARLQQYGEVLTQYPSLLEYFDLLSENGVDPLNIQELGTTLSGPEGAPQDQ